MKGHVNRLLLIFKFIIAFFLLINSYSCRKRDDKPTYEEGTNEYINVWILDSLKRYYLWNEQLPSKVDLSASPVNFFSTVRNRADRFSFVVRPGDLSTYPINILQRYGFDFAIIEVDRGKVIGVIKQVLKESPASRAGLSRGAYFTRINDKELNESNRATLEKEIFNNNKASFTLAEVTANQWIEKQVVTLSTGVIPDQGNLNKVIETDGRKIGYLQFNDFPLGLSTSLLPVFNNFKTARITDLIVDLRYNSGGQVSEAAAICAMIAPSLTYNKPFIAYKANKNGSTRTESIGEAATFDKRANFNDLLQHNLGLNRLYVLSSGATASASEIIINNLKPYIDVILIGTKTTGKDLASFPIIDFKKPKLIEWEIYPIIYQLFNSAGNGNYGDGITPLIAINELAQLPLQPLGSSDDPLIKAALARITGKATVSLSQLQNDRKKIVAVKVLSDPLSASAQLSSVITHR